MSARWSVFGIMFDKKAPKVTMMADHVLQHERVCQTVYGVVLCWLHCVHTYVFVCRHTVTFENLDVPYKLLSGMWDCVYFFRKFVHQANRVSVAEATKYSLCDLQHSTVNYCHMSYHVSVFISDLYLYRQLL